MKNKKQKQIVIGSIIGILLLIGCISLYRTFAMYKIERSFEVLNGTVPDFSKTVGDVKIAVSIDDEMSSEIPSKGSEYMIKEVNCNNGAVGNWNIDSWNLNISNLTKTNTICNLNFNKYTYKINIMTTSIDSRGAKIKAIVYDKDEQIVEEKEVVHSNADYTDTFGIFSMHYAQNVYRWNVRIYKPIFMNGKQYTSGVLEEWSYTINHNITFYYFA